MLSKIFCALATFLALTLTPTQGAKADECDQLWSAWKKKYPMPEKLDFTFPNFSSTPKTDDIEFQKGICRDYSKMLAEEKQALAERRQIDRACGKRVRWIVCDTACAAKRLPELEKKAAEECSPARIREIEKRRDDEAKSGSRIEGCAHLTVASDKKGASDPQWPTWAKGCNELDRTICINAWFHLEEVGIPTTGLTCRPSQQERTARKNSNDEWNSPAATLQRDRHNACLTLITEVQSGRADPRHDEAVKMCNDAEQMSCSIARSTIEDDMKKPNPGLTCEKPDMGGWK